MKVNFKTWRSECICCIKWILLVLFWSLVSGCSFVYNAEVFPEENVYLREAEVGPYHYELEVRVHVHENYNLHRPAGERSGEYDIITWVYLTKIDGLLDATKDVAIAHNRQRPPVGQKLKGTITISGNQVKIELQYYLEDAGKFVGGKEVNGLYKIVKLGGIR